VLLQVRGKLRKVNVLQLVIDWSDCSARGTAVLVVWDQDSIDVRLEDTREGAQNFRHLRRRAVFSLPAESVTDAVYEANKSLGVDIQQISSHEVLCHL